MHDIQTSVKGLTLARPNPDRDALAAFDWFNSPYGKETLLLMGNVEGALSTLSLKEETDRISNFLRLEKENKQLTWMIRYNNKTIGAVWLELQDTEYVKSPAFHIMIGNKSYRGKGFGKAVIQEMITYTRGILKSRALYSRHLTSNSRIAHLNSTFGFTNDGEPYQDNDGLEFQNVKLEF